MSRLLLLNLLILSSCATPPVPTPDEVRVNAAVKERYWRMQAAQRTGPHRTVPILQPECVENGARRVPTLIQLDYP